MINSIKEATEIYEKNENAGALVGDLLRIIKSQKAEVERLEKDTAAAKTELKEFKNLYVNEIAKMAIKTFAKSVNRRLNSNTPRGAYLYNIMKEVEKELTECK